MPEHCFFSERFDFVFSPSRFLSDDRLVQIICFTALQKTIKPVFCSELVSTFSSRPSCVVLSPDGQMVVVGTGQGTLHIINTQTGQVGGSVFL